MDQGHLTLIPDVTVTVHCPFSKWSVRGIAALGDAVRLVGDDDNGRGGMSMMQVMVSGIN